MEENAIPMEIGNPHVAGIDIGSRSHWVAVYSTPQSLDHYHYYYS